MSNTKNEIQLKSVSLDAAGELLQFMAAHQDFSGVVNALNKKFSATELQAMFKELGAELVRVAEFQASEEVPSKIPGMNPRSKKLLASLSPLESQKLLSNFGMLD